MAAASPVVEHRLSGFSKGSTKVLEQARKLQESRCTCLVILATCGVSLDQGSTPCPLHWQADSHPLYHEGGLPQPLLAPGNCPSFYCLHRFGFFGASPQGMQDRSSPPGIKPVPPTVEVRSFNN